MFSLHLKTLATFADQKLKEFGLHEQGWRFQFDRARTRFGCCRFDARLITVSRALALANSEVECRDTVLHEIAHAIAGKEAGHGPAWKQACRLSGATPVRCYNSDAVKQPDPAYWAECPHCDHRVGYFKKPVTIRACRHCCVKYSGGRYDERFRLRVLDARTGQEISQDSSRKSVPVRQPRYVGTCPKCSARYPFYRVQNFNKACGACCRRYAAGKYDERFRLAVSEVKPK
jgi:predicted SprT family Zn-dependent metalloprotease